MPWVSSAIHVSSRWKIHDSRYISNTDNTQTKHNPGQANDTKHSKTKIPWFSRLLQHSARKRDGVILQYNAPKPHLLIFIQM